MKVVRILWIYSFQSMVHRLQVYYYINTVVLLTYEVICYTVLYNKTFGLNCPVWDWRDHPGIKKSQITEIVTFELAILQMIIHAMGHLKKGKTHTHTHTHTRWRRVNCSWSSLWRELIISKDKRIYEDAHMDNSVI